MSTSESGRISVYCPCGAKLKIAEKDLGRKAKCPKCAEVFTLQEPEDNDDGILEIAPDVESDLLSEMKAAAQKPHGFEAKPLGRTVTCANCNEKHPADARICVHCGYDSEKGKVVKRAAKASESDGVLVSIARRLGAFGLGCALSTGGALIGAGIWFVVAIFAQYEIGYIAWALGLLAGGGMAMGYRDRNTKAGATAALIAAGGIVAAKLAIFLYFNAADINTARAEIAQIGTDAHLEVIAGSANVIDHRVEQEAIRNQWSLGDARREYAYGIHSEAVEALTEEELATEVAKVDAWNNGARWNDQNYQTNFLIMHYAQQSWEQKLANRGEGYQGGYVEPGKREWRSLVDEARTRVEAMDPQEVATLAQGVDATEQRDARLEELTDQLVAIQVVREAVSPHDGDRYKELADATTIANKSMTSEELAAAIADNQAWSENGRWDDPEYLRLQLIYAKAEQSVQDEALRHFEQDDYEWTVSSEQWDNYHADATAEVSPLSDGEVVAETKKLEAEEAARIHAFIDQIQNRITTNTAKEAMSYFFDEYFDGMDLIFGFFAIATAWGIASGTHGE